MGNLLIAYSLMQHPPRATVRDALYSFERHSDHRCFYLNLAVRRVPRWLARVDFDAVVFQTTLLSERWLPDVFARVRRRAEPLKQIDAVKVALPQDEFYRSRDVCDFVEDFGVDHIFSVAPESEWPELYGSLDRDRVGISRVLTGYLSSDSLAKAGAAAESATERPLDIGYRAFPASPWWGREGRLKLDIADAVAREAAGRDLRTDISTEVADTIHGDAWYRFLASAKYTLGAEGGASIHDPEGQIMERSKRYLAEHPEADVAEVEAACFPDAEGSLALDALSPRQLEACATRTCQILVEGDYNGILRAGEHYIPVKRDLSDVAAALDAVQRDELRAEIVERAHRDVVVSGAYTYESFVGKVEEEIAAVAERIGKPSSEGTMNSSTAHRAAALADRASSSWVALYLTVVGTLRPLVVRVLPERGLAWLRRRLAGRAVETASVESALRKR